MLCLFVFMPYGYITDHKMRELESEVECAIKKLEMKVVGMFINASSTTLKIKL